MLAILILVGLLLGGALHSDHFRITDGGLARFGNDHQAITIGAEICDRLLPHSKVAGWIVGTPIEDTVALPRLALHQIAIAERTEGSRLIYK